MTSTEELTRRATEAWAKMIRPRSFIFDTLAGTEPMPAFAAIDYVQDVCGERDAALKGLAQAACAWLSGKYPERWTVKKREDGTEYPDVSVWLNIAIGCVFHIASMHLSLAESILRELYRRVQDCLDPRVGGLDTAHSWNLWRREAERAIEKLREVEQLVSN